MPTKENIEDIIIVLCSITIGVCLTTVFFFFNPVIKETYVYYNNSQVLQPYVYNYNYTFQNNNYTYKVDYTDSRYDFINIINENAQTWAYNKGVYDCKNFTTIDYYDLKSRGYDVDKYTTYLKDRDAYHAFLGLYVYVEATTGRILNPDEYDEYGIPDLLHEYNDDLAEYKKNPGVRSDYISVCNKDY